jgi:hypothetical protein
MPTIHASGTWTSSTTETVIGTAADTTDATIQIWIDRNALTVGKEITIRAKEAVVAAGTQRVCLERTIKHAPGGSKIWVSEALMMVVGWEVSLQEVGASSSLSIPWSLRKV